MVQKVLIPCTVRPLRLMMKFCAITPITASYIQYSASLQQSWARDNMGMFSGHTVVILCLYSTHGDNFIQSPRTNFLRCGVVALSHALLYSTPHMTRTDWYRPPPNMRLSCSIPVSCPVFLYFRSVQYIFFCISVLFKVETYLYFIPRFLENIHSLYFRLFYYCLYFQYIFVCISNMSSRYSSLLPLLTIYLPVEPHR